MRHRSAHHYSQFMHRLSQWYIIALLVIALLTGLSWFWIQQALNQYADGAHVVNLAGRQRMLSQKLTKDILVLRLLANNQTAYDYRQELQRTLIIWQQVHRGLQQGDSFLNLPADNNSAHINELFQRIEPHYQTLLKIAQAFLDSAQSPQVLEQLFIAEKTFLSIMDAIVFEYAQEALIHVKLIKYLETIQAIIILIALLLVGFSLFRPAIKKIQEIFSELQFSETRWRYLSQATLEGLALHEQGQLSNANASLIKMFGYPLEELKTKNIIDLVSKAAREQVHQHLTSKSSTSCEVMGLHKNGSCFPIALSLDYIVSEGTGAAIARFQDLSQRKQMEALVHQQQQQLQAVLDNTPAVIYVKDVYGQYQLINQQYEQLFKVSQETIRGRTDHDIFPHSIADSLKSNDNQVIIKKQPLKFEEEVLQEDGLHTYISVKFPLYDAQEHMYAVCGISTDITERKWMEEALRQRETTLRALLDAIPEAVLLIDNHYRILNANKTIIEQLQTTVFNGANLFNFLPPEVVAQRKKYVDQVIASGQAVRFEDHYESTYFAHSIYPILNQHHEVIQLALLSADITSYKQTQATIQQLNQELEQRVAHRTAELEASNQSLHQEIAARQQVELALRQSEAQFRLLMEQISAATLICQQGQILYANPAAVAFTGYDVETLSQMAVWELVAPPVQEQVKQCCLKLPQCEQLQSHYELQCLTQQGQLRWLDLTVQAIEYKCKESILATGFEITERKRIETILRHLIEKVSSHTGDNFLKSLVNYLAETLQVSYVFIGQLNLNNPQMVTAIHVYDQKNDRVEQFDYSLAHTPCEQVIAQKKLCCYTHAVQEHFPLDDMLTTIKAESYYGAPLLDSYGNLVGIIVIIDNKPLENTNFIASLLQIFALRAAAEIQRLHVLALLETERADLTQRVKNRTLELTQTNLALEQALRHKDEFLASMSHELRTPLNVILNNLELLEEGIYGALTPLQQHSLTLMKDNGAHLLTLITDILDLANIETGKLELMLESFEVEPFCQACLDSIKPLAQKKQLQVNLNLDPAIHMIQADPARLKQIILNLLSNAVKFTPVNGQISLEVTTAQKQIHFKIIDNGIGIGETDMECLFQPFTQLDRGLARKYEGSGLGLVLAYRLTELQGGSIAVTSTVGQGSCFTVSLPEPHASMSPKRQLTSMPTRYVLLAEEHPVEAISLYLQAQGYQLFIAHDGVDALALARQHQPDIILIDIQLPVLNGLEVIRQLRTECQFDMTIIIALSALSKPGDQAACLKAGAHVYLTKPFSVHELLQLMESQLSTIHQSNEAHHGDRCNLPSSRPM